MCIQSELHFTQISSHPLTTKQILAIPRRLIGNIMHFQSQHNFIMCHLYTQFRQSRTALVVCAASGHHHQVCSLSLHDPRGHCRKTTTTHRYRNHNQQVTGAKCKFSQTSYLTFRVSLWKTPMGFGRPKKQRKSFHVLESSDERSSEYIV